MISLLSQKDLVVSLIDNWALEYMKTEDKIIDFFGSRDVMEGLKEYIRLNGQFSSFIKDINMETPKNPFLERTCAYVAYILEYDVGDYNQIIKWVINMIGIIPKKEINKFSILVSILYHLLDLRVRYESNEYFDLFKVFIHVLHSLDSVSHDFYRIIYYSFDDIYNYALANDNYLIDIVAKVLNRQKSIEFEKANSILGSLGQKITAFDETSIDFLSQVIPCFPLNAKKEFISLLSFSLSQYLLQNIDIHSFIDKNQKCLKIKDIKEVLFRFETTIRNDISFDWTHLYKRVDFEECYPKTVFDRMNKIISIIHDDENMEKCFLEFFHEYETCFPENFAYFSVFLFFISRLSHKVTMNFAPIFLSSSFFLYECKSNSNQSERSILYSLHWSAFHILTSISFDEMMKIISSFSMNPSLFSEFLYYITVNEVFNQFDESKRSSFIKYVLVNGLHYITEHSSDNYRIISSECIKYFLSHFFKFVNNLGLVFNNDTTSTIMISLAFNQNFQSLTFQAIQDFTANFQGSLCFLISSLSLAINIIICSLLSDQSIDLLIGFLNCLNTSLSVNHNAASQVSNLKPTILSLLDALSSLSIKSPKYEDLIRSIILFLTHTYYGQKTEEVFAEKLERAIMVCYSNENIMDLYPLMMQLLAGKTLSSINDKFIIGEPYFLRIITNVYSKHSEFYNILQSLKSLLVFTRKNRISAHIGSLDLNILHILDNYISEEKPDMNNVKVIFSILYLIARTISSREVVENYFEIIRPINNTYISYIFPSLISFLSKIITRTSRNPIGFFPINSENSFSASRIDSSLLDHGFTFLFWINIEDIDNKIKLNLVTINDGSHKEFRVDILMNQLIISVKGKKTVTKSIIDKGLNMNTWTFCSISLRPDINEGGVFVEVFFDYQRVHEISYQWVCFAKGEISCIIGENRELISENTSVLIGSFGLFKSLSLESISQIGNLGPQTLNHSDNCILFVKTMKNEEYLFSYNSYQTNEQIYIEFKGPFIKQDPVFCDCLVDNVGSDFVLSTLSYLELTFPNGEKYSKYSYDVIELIFSFVLLYPTVHEQIIRNHFFLNLGCFFANSKLITIDYSLYMKFFNLYEKVPNQEIQKSICFSILTNSLIWIISDPSDHEKVLRHWNRHLFPSIINSGHLCFSFEMALNTLYLYYYWKKNEAIQVEYIREKAGKTLDIDLCKNLMNGICLQISLVSFCHHDLVLIVSTILNSHCSSDTVSFLRLLQMLIKSNPSPIDSIIQGKNTMLLLLYILNRKSKRVILEAVNTLIIISKYYPTLTSMFELSNIFLSQISFSDMSEGLYETLLNHIKNESKELFPIAIWVAFCLERLESFFENICPDKRFVSNNAWAVWPIYISFYCDTKDQQRILSFLYDCSSFSSWIYIICSIDYVGQVIGCDGSSLQRKFISLMISNTKNSDSIQSKLIICDVTTWYLLFSNTSSHIIDELYKTSPFYNEDSLSHNRSLSLNFMDLPDFVLHTQDHTKKPFDLFQSEHKIRRILQYPCFSLRFDSNIEWTDFPTAHLVKEFFQDTSTIQDRHLYIVLSELIERQSQTVILSSNFMHSVEFLQKNFAIRHHATRNSIIRQFQHFFSSIWNKTILYMSMVDDDVVSASINSCNKTKNMSRSMSHKELYSK